MLAASSEGLICATLAVPGWPVPPAVGGRALALALLGRLDPLGRLLDAAQQGVEVAGSCCLGAGGVFGFSGLGSALATSSRLLRLGLGLPRPAWLLGAGLGCSGLGCSAWAAAPRPSSARAAAGGASTFLGGGGGSAAARAVAARPWRRRRAAAPASGSARPWVAAAAAPGPRPAGAAAAPLRGRRLGRQRRGLRLGVLGHDLDRDRHLLARAAHGRAWPAPRSGPPGATCSDRGGDEGAAHRGPSRQR